MKLIKLHIDGFGKLSRYDRTFRDGLNVILGENGWGKTTLTAFLKAMLSGLTPDERRRYRPQNGGSFGGTLELEIQGRRCSISRSFGETPEADMLSVKDAADAPAEERLAGLQGDVLMRSILSCDELTEAAQDGGAAQIQAEITRCEERRAAQAQEITRQEGVLAQKAQILAAQEQSRALLEQQEEKLQSIAAQLAEQEASLARYKAEQPQREQIAQIGQELGGLTQQLAELAGVFGGNLPDAKTASRLQTLQQQTAAAAQEQQDLAASLGGIAARCGGTLPETALPDTLQRLSEERKGLLSEIAQITDDESDAPDAYKRIRDAGDPTLPEKLQEAVSAEKQLQTVRVKLDETDRLLREERALWEERRGKFLELHKTTAALQAEVDAQPDNSPEVIGPVLEQAKALQTRCADLTRQIEDCEKGCAEAERLWGDRQQRYAIMREEVDRMQADLDKHSGYDAGEVKKTVALISDMQKRRARLSEDERAFKETLNLETVRWEEQRKHYESLRADADRLTEQAKATAQYDSELSDPMQRLLEETQETEENLRNLESAAEHAALTPEEAEMLRSAPAELPETELCTAVIHKSRKLSKLRSDLAELQTKQEQGKEQLETLRTAAEECPAVPDAEHYSAGAPVGLILLIGGIVLAAGGVILGIAVHAAFFALAAAGVICAVIGFVLHARWKELSAAAAEKEAGRQKLLTQQNELNERISVAENNAEALAEKEKTITEELADCEAAVDDWCRKWFPDGDAASLPERAAQFQTLQQLKEKQQNYQSTLDKAEALRRRIDGNLKEVYANYPELQGKTAVEAYKALQEGEADYRIVCRERDTSLSNLKSWLKSCGYDENMKLTKDGRSPKIVHLEEKIEAVNRAWEALNAEKEALYQKYPDIRGMDGEAALLFLTRQGEEYRLAAARKKTAERKLIAFYAETKLNADLMGLDTSPEIPVLREQQAALREELEAAATTQRRLCERYPEAQNVSPEEAAAALQERLSGYRLLNGRLQTALQEEAQFLGNGRFSREELLGDGSAAMQELEQARHAAEAEQLRLTECCTETLQLVGIAAEPLAAGMQKAADMLQAYQSYLQIRQERLERCQAMRTKADDLLKQQETLAGAAFPDQPMDERIRLLREALQEAAVLQTKAAQNAERAAKLAEEADAALASYTGTGTDRMERLAGALARAQEAQQIKDAADKLTQQQDAIRKTLLDVDGDALQTRITALSQEQTELRGSISREQEAARAREAQLAVFPKAETALQSLRESHKASGVLLERLQRTAACLAETPGEDFRKTLQTRADGYLQQMKLRSKDAVHCSGSERSMLALCERMALADTLFAEEQPFLLLDDPLLRLDEKQFAAAAGMLRTYAKKHQILYFTCHPSRKI